MLWFKYLVCHSCTYLEEMVGVEARQREEKGRAKIDFMSILVCLVSLEESPRLPLIKLVCRVTNRYKTMS